ncbi:MAG: hypothetical protein EXS31_17805 [Pedosphaera sp.]|nr:hypothetical protein [Pedosphaera sp.]
MKLNKWTLALTAAGVVSLGSIVQAEEAQHQVMTALSSSTLSGYVDTSANWRVGKTAGFIPGRTFDGMDKQDGFNLNVVKLTLEKPLDEGQWSAGYKADLVFGPDANYYGTTLNGGGGPVAGDFAVKQAYANFRAPVGNGIDFKMGVFDTIIGYEVYESGNNPNYSRSYGYSLEPTHHTGLLASYHIVDNVSVSAGIADTAFGAINGRAARGGVPASQTEKAYMGSISITVPDSVGFLKGSTFYAGAVDGLGGNTIDTTSVYGGLTLNTPVTGLTGGFAFDYRFNGPTGAGGIAPVKDSWAYAAAVYAAYQTTEKLKFAVRGDWTEGSAGTYYAGTEKNELLGITLTADYSLWSNLITRLEGRWDHAIGGDRPFPAAGVADRNVFTLALNTIFKF